MMRGPLAPTERDASTNSRSFNDSTTPRTILATAIHPTADSSEDHESNGGLVTHDGLERRVARPARCCRTNSETRIGKAKKMSVMRIRMSSNQSAAVAGNRADDRADGAGDERHGDADHDRDSAAVEDSAVEVAVEVVGAEPAPSRWAAS